MRQFKTFFEKREFIRPNSTASRHVKKKKITYTNE